MGTSEPVTVVVLGAGPAAPPGVHVLAHADEPRHAPRLVAAARPQVVLVGLGRDRDAVLAVVSELTVRVPDARVLAVSGTGDPAADVLAAVRAGASGYLVPADDPEALADAVRRTAGGEAVFSPGLAEVVLEEYGRPLDPAQVAADRARGRRAAPGRRGTDGAPDRDAAGALAADGGEPHPAGAAPAGRAEPRRAACGARWRTASSESARRPLRVAPSGPTKDVRAGQAIAACDVTPTLSAETRGGRMGGRVVVVGAVNVDFVVAADRLPGPGETVVGPRVERFGGGKGANAAVAAARAGADVRLIGAVGDDDTGRAALDELRADGVRVDGVAVLDGVPTGVALIVVDAAGENQIAVGAGANGGVERDRVRDALVDALPDIDCVLVSTEIPLAAVAVAVETATAVGVPCVLNPAPVLPGLAGLLVPGRACAARC